MLVISQGLSRQNATCVYCRTILHQSRLSSRKAIGRSTRLKKTSVHWNRNCCKYVPVASLRRATKIGKLGNPTFVFIGVSAKVHQRRSIAVVARMLCAMVLFKLSNAVTVPSTFWKKTFTVGMGCCTQIERRRTDM